MRGHNSNAARQKFDKCLSSLMYDAVDKYYCYDIKKDYKYGMKVRLAEANAKAEAEAAAKDKADAEAKAKAEAEAEANAMANAEAAVNAPAKARAGLDTDKTDSGTDKVDSDTQASDEEHEVIPRSAATEKVCAVEDANLEIYVNSKADAKISTDSSVNPVPPKSDPESEPTSDSVFESDLELESESDSETNALIEHKTEFYLHFSLTARVGDVFQQTRLLRLLSEAHDELELELTNETFSFETKLLNSSVPPLLLSLNVNNLESHKGIAISNKLTAADAITSLSAASATDLYTHARALLARQVPRILPPYAAPPNASLLYKWRMPGDARYNGQRLRIMIDDDEFPCHAASLRMLAYKGRHAALNVHTCYKMLTADCVARNQANSAAEVEKSDRLSFAQFLAVGFDQCCNSLGLSTVKRITDDSESESKSKTESFCLNPAALCDRFYNECTTPATKTYPAGTVFALSMSASPATVNHAMFLIAIAPIAAKDAPGAVPVGSVVSETGGPAVAPPVLPSGEKTTKTSIVSTIASGEKNASDGDSARTTPVDVEGGLEAELMQIWYWARAHLSKSNRYLESRNKIFGSEGYADGCGSKNDNNRECKAQLEFVGFYDGEQMGE